MSTPASCSLPGNIQIVQAIPYSLDSNIYNEARVVTFEVDAIV